MSPHVLALDLALANAGAATITDTGRVATWLKQTPPLGDDPPLHAVDARISSVARWAVHLATTGTVLVVLEGPALYAEHGMPHERAGLWWRVVRGFHARELPVAVLTPATMKGYITGRGTASKADVHRGVVACWPKECLDRISEHEADAVGLATAACDWLGWPGPWLEGRRGAGWLKKARWPERDAVNA